MLLEKLSWCKERTERLTLDSADAVGSRVGPTHLGTGCCVVHLIWRGCAMAEWEVCQDDIR